MRIVLPVISSLSVVLTACSSKQTDSSSLEQSTSTAHKLTGEWLCFEMDGVGFPVVYSEESIAAFTDNPSVIGIQKAVFMSIQDSYDGTLTSNFYYDYDDGTMGMMEAPLPLTAQGTYPHFQIQSFEGDSNQAEIILDCRLSEAKILGCGYQIGGMSPEGASITFRSASDE